MRSPLLTLSDQVFNESFLRDTSAAQLEEKPFNPLSEVERNKSQEISITTGEALDEVEAKRELGDGSAEAQAKINHLKTDFSADIDAAYNEGMTSDDVATIIQEKAEKGKDMTVSEYLMIQNLMLGDRDVNPYAARTLSNMTIWNNLMVKAIEENDQSGFSKFLTFLDVNVLREITLGAFENVTFRSNREGSEIREAFNGKTPAEFEEWAKEYIVERRDEGFFSRDSIWNLYKQANDATYLGSDPMAGFNALFGVADIATLGSTKIARGAVRGAVTGTKATVSSAPEIASKLTSLAKSRKPIDTVAVMSDEVNAANVLTKIVDDTGVQTDKVNAGRSLPEDLDPVKGPIERPSLAAVRENTNKNNIIEELETANRNGSFGEYLPRAVIEQVAEQTAKKVASRTNNVVVKTSTLVDEGSEDFKVVVRMGKDGSGTAFRRKMDAEAIAAKDPSLRVVKKEQGRGWWVETEQRLNLADKSPQAEMLAKNNIVADAIDKVIGDATGRLGDRLGAKFLQAEAGQALIGNIVKPYEKTIRAVKGKELENLSDFFTQLRDGKYSHERKTPTRAAFEARYQKDYGMVPSKKVGDAYEALVDINDASWHIQSSARLKRAVEGGGVFAQLTDGLSSIAYRVRASSVDDQVLDLVTGRPILKEKLDGDLIIFRLEEPLMDHVYVTNVKSTRVLERVDVMPYNVGGPRTNAEFRWFVGTIKEQAIRGKTISTGLKTMLGSFGKKQAETAQFQLNTIAIKIDELMKNAGVTKLEDLTLSKADYEELGDLIRANNDWNKHVTDLEDLQKLGKEYNFNFNEKFVLKARDEKVTVDMAGQNPTRIGLTVGEDVSTTLNGQGMKRRDTPLMEYGGKKATNDSPLAAIADQFGSEVYGYANRAATKDAIEGWGLLAEANNGLIKNWDDIKGLDPMQRFLQAEVTTTGKFNDIATQLREQQAVIKRRLNQPTLASKAWEVFTTQATEAIFEKTGKKSIAGFSLDLTKTDPASRLLQVGFYSKFGFFNPDQFMLQALHSIVIAGISPKYGTKAMGLTAPMLAIMHPNLSKPARDLAIQRLSNFTKLSVDELNDLVRYIDESGRNIIDNQVIELQGPQKFGASSTLLGKSQEGVGKFLDFSTLFFKEGERSSRLTGIITAFLEHQAKRPDISPFSPEGKRWITNREQDLTFRMTTQSRSLIQSGPMRVPTQWLSYSLRSLSNIAVGRNFTAGERFGMFATLGPLWGLTGLGLGQTAGYVTEKLGYSAEDPESVKMFNSVKYGLFDQLLGWTLGTETAYATRVAPAEQVKDTYRKLFEDPLLSTLFGPSGQIANDMYKVGSNAVKSMVSGRTSMVREDLTQLLRNLSTVDKGYKIAELIETGNYRSKTYKLSVSGLTPNDAAAVLVGATPAPVQNYYDYREMVYKKNQDFKEISTKLKSKATLAMDLLTNGDKDDMIRGDSLWTEITDELWASRLSNELKISLQNSLINVGQIPDIFRNAHRLELERESSFLSHQMQ